MRLDPFSHLDEKLYNFLFGSLLLLMWWALTLDCRAKPPQPPTITLLYERPESVSYVRSQRGGSLTQTDLFKPCAWTLNPKSPRRNPQQENPETIVDPT